MTAGVLGEAISLYSSTAFLTQLPNTADTEPPSPPAKFLFKLKVLPMEILWLSGWEPFLGWVNTDSALQGGKGPVSLCYRMEMVYLREQL